MKKDSRSESIDKMFGKGTAARVEQSRRREPLPPGISAADRMREIRKSLERMLSPGAESQARDPSGDFARLLSPSRYMPGAVSKAESVTTVTSEEVSRVDRVLEIADGLMLKRANVQALIEKVGFDEVEATLTILAGEAATKSLRSPMGIVVKSVSASDVEQIIKQRQVTKERDAETDPLKKFMGPFIK